VLIEQEPGVKYKLASADGSLHVMAASDVVKMSKARNKLYRGRPVATAADGDGNAVGATFEPPTKRYVEGGVRIESDVSIIFPIRRDVGDNLRIGPSIAPTFRVGYEKMIGPLGVSGGAMGRFTYWNTEEPYDGDAGPATWTTELHVYAKGAFHLGRVAAYVGGSMGPDLTFIYSDEMGGWENTQGLGINLTTGVAIAVTRVLSLDVGIDFHPPTRAIYNSGFDLSYLALRIGAQLTL